MTTYIINTSPIEIDPNRMNDALIELMHAGILIPAPVEEWPKIEDEYWYVDSASYIGCNTFENDSSDKWRKATGNCFRTESEASKFREDTLKGGK